MDSEEESGSDEGEVHPRARAKRVIINVSSTQYDVVRDVARKVLRWKLSFKEDDDNWDLFWLDTGMTPERLMRMKPYQKINHFPGMYTLARKNTLAINLNNLKKTMPEAFGFFPATWVLPHDGADFRAQFNEKRAKTFIVKPEASCQGRGIFLTRNYEQINPTERYVVQRYMHKPFLIDGLKFDLRVYVLVAGCDPLRVFIHEEGLARFATEPYVPPTRSNLAEVCMHLTNYAINKNSPNFVFNNSEKADDIGHKKSLTALLRILQGMGHDVGTLLREIERIIVYTLCCAQPLLSQIYRACQPYDPGNGMCFEILGFDIFLDHKLKPWLLEVNHSPSFTTDTPLDRNIKERVILDAISLLGISAENREKYYTQVKQQVHQRAVRGKDYHALRSERLLLQKQTLEERDALEAQHTGGFRKIYPTADSGAARLVIDNAQKLLSEQTGGRPKPRKEEVKVDSAPRARKPPACPQKLEPAQEEPTPRRNNFSVGRAARHAVSAEPPPAPESVVAKAPPPSQAAVGAVHSRHEAVAPKPPPRSSRDRLPVAKPTSSGEFVKPKTVQLDVKESPEHGTTARARLVESPLRLR